MLSAAGEQVESVWQQRQDGMEAALCAGRAARQVDDERAASDAAEAAAKSRKLCLFSAAKADLLSDAGDKAIAD
jgi:hypothetical protein